MSTRDTAGQAAQVAQVAEDVAQLVDPIAVAVRQRRRAGPVRWYVVDHPPLLDQLRAAARPGMVGRGAPDHARVPESRPPVSLDAVDRLARIETGIIGWRQRLLLAVPARGDWVREVLRELGRQASTLPAPDLADLADDVDWWLWTAARTCGWDAADLLRARQARCPN